VIRIDLTGFDQVLHFGDRDAPRGRHHWIEVAGGTAVDEVADAIAFPGANEGEVGADDDVIDKVKGLELGADDYVTKPFNHLELLARVKALLRRLDMPQPHSRAPSFQSGDLTVDFAAREVRRDGEPVALTATEYKLLYHLVRNAGHVLPHETLLAKVWGREYLDEIDYLRVYIRRLRLKLERDPEHPRHILTERGLGYRFQKEA
jgi:two-component system KDP operon response regulator KdpE